MHKRDEYKRIVRKLLDQRSIRVKKWFDWRRPTDTAYAWLTEDDQPMVVLPYPKTLTTFYICLHEIGHIARPSSISHQHDYIAEYMAETWALDYCKNKLGINPEREERHAKAYVLHKLLKQWRVTVDESNLRMDILKWLNLTIHQLDIAACARRHFGKYYKKHGTI